jgi:NADH-quinone oxidoreductase subunit M
MPNTLLCSLLLILPAVFAVVIGFAGSRAAKQIAAVGSILTLILAAMLFLGYASVSGATAMVDQTYQSVTEGTWFPALNIEYKLGVDGPAGALVLLTAFLQVAVVVFSFQAIKEREREYYALLMALEAALFGAFMSLDLVLFYIFFEVCLVPAYFLIGIWGGRNRLQAATKFFVYTVVGSLLMLASIIGLYLRYGTFDVVDLQRMIATSPPSLSAELLLFSGFAIALAIKTGLFPFHTWLPDTYAEAPAPVTAILSGVMAKLGTYGFLRFGLQLFPNAVPEAAPLMVTLGVVSIIYGALVAAMQRDAKRTIAYSSISHLGFVIVGLFALNETALYGAILQMVNHGITSGLLFLLLGYIYMQRGTTKLVGLGGLWRQMPLFGRIFLIATLSSVALPLTNGFVGEFMILLGAYPNFPSLTVLATTGVIWSAIYMLWMFQRAMYGPVRHEENARLRDMTYGSWEFVVSAVFVILIFVLGVRPGLMLPKFESAVIGTLRAMHLTTPGMNVPETNPAPTVPLTAPTPSPTETAPQEAN